LVQTHVRVDISLNNTVAIPDQFENTDWQIMYPIKS
jgi:hypothetical protein